MKIREKELKIEALRRESDNRSAAFSEKEGAASKVVQGEAVKTNEAWAEVGDLVIQKQLDEVQERAKTLAAQVNDLTAENNRLQGLLEKLEASYAELEKKLKDFQAAGKDLKSGLPLNP